MERYDPRLRPWYVEGQTHTEPHCGEPYPDASGSGYLLLPCNQRVNKPNGELLAVGLDFLVDSVLENLELAKPTYVKEVLLLNQQGEILLSSVDKGKQVDSLRRADNNKSKEKVLLKQS